MCLVYNLVTQPKSKTWKGGGYIVDFGPSGVRALPLAPGRNVGGHYTWHFGPSGVRALPLAAGRNEVCYYFR